MMKLMVKTGILMAAFLLLANAVEAQKFGYVNSAAIVVEMPEMKQLQSSLEAFQKVKKKEGEAKVASFEQKRLAAQQKKERMEMTPKEEQTVTAELQKLQEEIYQFSANAEQEMAKKQQDEMAPILEKVNTAILTDAVKTKLGIPLTKANTAVPAGN